MKPMLAETLKSERLLAHYTEQDAWTFTQKIDGWRKLVLVDGGKVQAHNRKGEPADLPKPIADQLACAFSKGCWALDGELLNGVLWLFDLPQAGELVTVKSPYAKRRQALEQLFSLIDQPNVKLVPRAETPADKTALFCQVRDANAEGVMLNHVDMPYVPGRRSTYVLKWKFWNDIDCVVTRLRVGGKDNFEVALFRNGTLTPVGEVTALAGDGAKVQVGNVVCVKYAYCGVNDRLYGPPTLPKIRDDKAPEECTWDQLIYPSKDVIA